MKCVCGYEHEVKEEKAMNPIRRTWHTVRDTTKGDEPFVWIGDVTGTIDEKSAHFKQYGCPKCGTVRIQRKE